MKVSAKVTPLHSIKDDFVFYFLTNQEYLLFPIVITTIAGVLTNFRAKKNTLTMERINLKRIYDTYEPSDGYRILVDRLWPRGIKKTDAHIDLWLKEIAPSNELRKWFGHETDKWEAFSQKYVAELQGNKEAAQQLLSAVKDKKKVTLLFGAKDETHNQAVVLLQWLLNTSFKNGDDYESLAL